MTSHKSFIPCRHYWKTGAQTHTNWHLGECGVIKFLKSYSTRFRMPVSARSRGITLPAVFTLFRDVVMASTLFYFEVGGDFSLTLTYDVLKSPCFLTGPSSHSQAFRNAFASPSILAGFRRGRPSERSPAPPGFHYHQSCFLSRTAWKPHLPEAFCAWWRPPAKACSCQ